MTNLKRLFFALLDIIKSLRRKVMLSKYNSFTIAEYFRSQGAIIGKDCFFGINEIASEPFLVEIGNHVAVTTGVQLITHNLGWCFRDEYPDLQVFGKIKIEDNCTIGVNSIILPGVTIGENSIVGAGSVVRKSVPPNSIVMGNPAKVIFSMSMYKKMAVRQWALQKPEGYLPEIKQGVQYDPSYIHKLTHDEKNRELLKEHLIKIFNKP